ncbi:MAG: CBS domain-containing protein [Saprospiraceae bacterium]|nr:CBS domain-containing protein [Saprospiraceae bacterium]
MNTETPIRHIMSTEIIKVKPDDTLLKIEEIFSTNPIHHVLVTENSDLKGIISKNDIMNWMRRVLDGNASGDRSRILVQDIMTENPITLDCDDSIGLAADIFLVNKFHSLPVTDGGELVGIITNHDLIKYCFK